MRFLKRFDTLLTLLALFSVLPVFCATAAELGDEVFVKLKGEKLDLIGRDFYVLNVLDGRLDRGEVIGQFIQNEEVKKVVLQDGLSKAMRECLRASIPNRGRDLPLFVEVTRLDVHVARLAQRSEVQVNLALRFYQARGNELGWLYSTEEAYVDDGYAPSAKDSPYTVDSYAYNARFEAKDFQRAIFKALSLSLHQFNLSDWRDREPNFDGPPENEFDDSERDIRTAKKLVAGLYRTPDQMLANLPADQTIHIADRIGSGYPEKYRILRGDTPVKDAYGYCDGERVYLNASVFGKRGHYVPVLQIGKYIYVEDVKKSFIGSGDGLSFNRLDEESATEPFTGYLINPETGKSCELAEKKSHENLGFHPRYQLLFTKAGNIQRARAIVLEINQENEQPTIKWHGETKQD